MSLTLNASAITRRLRAAGVGVATSHTFAPGVVRVWTLDEDDAYARRRASGVLIQAGYEVAVARGYANALLVTLPEPTDDALVNEVATREEADTRLDAALAAEAAESPAALAASTGRYVVAYSPDGGRRTVSGSYSTLEDAEADAERRRARGECASTFRPCGHAHNRYRTNPACKTCGALPEPAVERPVDTIRQTIRREPSHEGVAGELALALLNAPDGHLAELDRVYAAHAETLDAGQQRSAAYVRTLIERRAWLRELIRRNDREVADRIPADRVRYAGDARYLASLDRQEANLRGQAEEARAALAAVGAAGPEHLPYGPVTEEERQADADRAQGTDADRVTISARASELRPGDLVVDSLGNRQHAAFDVKLDETLRPGSTVKVWTAVADQERGLPPVLLYSAGRELYVSRRLAAEQLVEAAELFDAPRS